MKRIAPLIAAVLLAASAHATDVDVVRRNFVDFYAATTADRDAPRMRDALASLESSARTNTAAGFLRDDGSWTDIDYSETPDGGWSPWEHSRRLFVMARAYHTPGQSLYRNPRLLMQITAALRYVPAYYGKYRLPLGNWWFWTIGVPLDLGPTLVLMQDHVDAQTIADCVDTMAVHIGGSPTARGLVGPTPIGENLVWSSYTHLCLALLRGDASMLANVRDAMAGVTLPTATGEGIKPDRSFHEHGAQLYTGGYGGSFANDVARYALLTRGTEYELPPASLQSFADYVVDGIAWSLYGNYFDVSVVGREVARVSTTGYNGIAALVQAAQLDLPRNAEIRSAAASMLRSWQWALPTELAGAAVLAERAGYRAAWPSGHRHYEWSDYTIHRRPSWFASVKMFSTRTRSGEKTNGENILGSRQSDGRFYLSLTGDEHFGSDTWPAMDWSRLPGITVEQKPGAADATYGYGTQRFAGGAGDENSGVSAMEVAPLGSALTAKKAWFFFDDVIVFLTNSINDLSGNPVETIVNQWPLSRADAPLVTDPSGRWALCDGVGYLFGGPVRLERQTRTGTWAALGGSTDTTLRQRTFMTMWVDHGKNPVNASAEYAIVPRATAASIAALAASDPFVILANNETVSAMRDRRTNARGIVFWTAGTVEGIQSDAPAIVYMTEDGLNTRISLADPTSGTGTIRLILPGRYASHSAFVATGIDTTTIQVPVTAGRTEQIELTRLPDAARRRSAR